MDRYLEIEYADNGYIIREGFESFNNITAVVEKDRFSSDELMKKLGEIVRIWITEDEVNDEIQYLQDSCVGMKIKAEINPICETTIKFKE